MFDVLKCSAKGKYCHGSGKGEDANSSHIGQTMIYLVL